MDEYETFTQFQVDFIIDNKWILIYIKFILGM